MNKQVWMAAVAAGALLLSGCGVEDTSTKPTAIAIAGPRPSPSSSPSAPPRSSINIQTYERLPTVAYPASVTSEVASLTTETVTVETPKSASEYSQLYFTKADYQPSWYPYTAQDTTPIQIGLYKAETINKQYNFTKAIIPHDAGGLFMDTYDAGLFPPTFDRIKIIGGNTVVYADSAIIKTMDISEKSVVLVGKYFPPDQVILDMGNLAKSRDLDFTVMMGIYPGDNLGNDTWTVPKFYSAIGQLSDSDPFWDVWFDAYKPILAERAALAQRAGATKFVVGFNLDYMVNKGNSRWAELIKAVRSSGFTGKISYFAGTNAASNGFLGIPNVNERNAFIALFDEVGLNIYSPIFSENGEPLLDAQPRSRVKKNLKNQIDKISSAKVPIFLMVGTPSVHSGLVTNKYIEPSYPCSYYKSENRNYQTQADVYQSAAEIVNDQISEGSVIVKGIFSWGYHYMDNPRRDANGADVCYDFSASIRNKPAEAVLSYWFKGW